MDEGELTDGFAWREIRTLDGAGSTSFLAGRRDIALLVPIKSALGLVEGYQLFVNGRLETQLVGVSLRRARSQAEPILRTRYPQWFRAATAAD